VTPKMGMFLWYLSVVFNSLSSYCSAQFSRARRSATRARKAFQPRASGSSDSTDQTEKTIRAMKRHRKQRHNILRDMTRQEDDSLVVAIMEGSGSTCPLCLITIQGDPDVVEAHVDSCLAHAVHLQG